MTSRSTFSVSLGLALSLLVPLALVPSAQQHPWPPGVRPVPDESPALAPDAAMKTFFLPPGYRLELVASEPMIEDPVWIDMDPDGRVWVVEMRGFMPDASGRGERAPVGRISVLEDDDDDGRMDRSTVFLDGLVLPRSVKVLDRGVLVAEPPHLWLARDTTGDRRADTKDAVREDFGRADGNPEHNANGLLWGLDNWIHSSEHDGQLRLRHGRWDHRPTLFRGQWGVTMDDAGRLYRNWNEDPLLVDVVDARYFVRNPNVVRTRGAYERIVEDLSVWPVRPTPGVNRGYREGILRPDKSVAVFVAAGSPVVYRGDRLPTELLGNVFVTEPAGNLVRRLVVREEAGGRVSARNAYDRAEFIASTDERFRPVNLYSAADGTLYVVDMYRGIIQHGAYQSEYLKNHIRARQLDRPIGHGRIYRVVHETTRRDRRPALSTQSPAALVELLAHPNGWWRDTAQQLLVERADRSVLARLRELVTARDVRTRLHALWTLDGLDASDPAILERALIDASPHVRAAAVRISERWLTNGNHSVVNAVRKLAEDPDATVRRQVAASQGELPESERASALGRMLAQFGNDPVAVDLAISGLHGLETSVLGRLLEETRVSEGRDDAVAQLSGAVMKSAREAELQRLFEWTSQADRPMWQRRALLQGMEAALPGSEGGAGLAARGGLRVALSRRPDALLTLARSKEREIGARAARIADIIEWPGKPRSVKPPPPLGPREQQRYTAGQQVYRSMCAPCHQVDGRGQQGLAPALLGSKWVLGRAGLAARIVLHGKEGTTMMPPLHMLSDEQVADVLTFVRRAWGHGASPVDAALVREVRGASAGRAKPWTEEELSGVAQPDGPPQRGR
jgi:mono/diheme cytochrome c family protein/glucose/arabinose dehydrogenase